MLLFFFFFFFFGISANFNKLKAPALDRCGRIQDRFHIPMSCKLSAAYWLRMVIGLKRRAGLRGYFLFLFCFVPCKMG